MPTYEYECNSCGHKFDVFQSMTAEPIKSCPQCRGKVRRLLGTGAGIIFKGSGFYQTDYRSSSYQKKAEADKKKVEPDKKSDSKDTKPSAPSSQTNPSTGK